VREPDRRIQQSLRWGEVFGDDVVAAAMIDRFSPRPSRRLQRRQLSAQRPQSRPRSRGDTTEESACCTIARSFSAITRQRAGSGSEFGDSDESARCPLIHCWCSHRANVFFTILVAQSTCGAAAQ
jgi:hypothetical protein